MTREEKIININREETRQKKERESKKATRERLKIKDASSRKKSPTHLGIIFGKRFAGATTHSCVREKENRECARESKCECARVCMLS